MCSALSVFKDEFVFKIVKFKLTPQNGSVPSNLWSLSFVNRCLASGLAGPHWRQSFRWQINFRTHSLVCPFYLIGCHFHLNDNSVISLHSYQFFLSNMILEVHLFVLTCIQWKTKYFPRGRNRKSVWTFYLC